jgi:hypothetical protein
MSNPPGQQGEQMTSQTMPTKPGSQFLVHDVIIGLLAGAGVGSVIGVFIAVRWFDNNLVTLAGALVGAALGVMLLLRSHQRHDRFLTPAVVLSWVLLVASGAFIAALVFAIATFN